LARHDQSRATGACREASRSLQAILRRGAAAAVALVVSATSAQAQGVSFGAPGRVPRQHDTDIGSSSTGDPALDYVLHCQGCHQAGGVGLAGAVPALKDSVAAVAALPGGREYLGRVPGVAQSQLDDRAVAALLNWLLVYFDAAHVPADFRPFTAEELAPLRRRPLVQASAARAALVAGAAPSR
jgi:mono/diheme cytochrome c family protein